MVAEGIGDRLVGRRRREAHRRQAFLLVCNNSAIWPLAEALYIDGSAMHML